MGNGVLVDALVHAELANDRAGHLLSACLVGHAVEQAGCGDGARRVCSVAELR